MMSWRRWGMRALALAMLLSLSAGPLMAGPRGGHNNGDEILDLVDGPGTDYFGDPDAPYGRFEEQLTLLRMLRLRLVLGIRMAAPVSTAIGQLGPLTTADADNRVVGGRRP